VIGVTALVGCGAEANTSKDTTTKTGLTTTTTGLVLPEAVTTTVTSTPAGVVGTAPLATDPPATDPPATDPPATDPPATNPPAVYYANCTAVRDAGAAPIYRGEPGYRSGLDRDNDGIACDTTG
jgi:hypothetical protein